MGQYFNHLLGNEALCQRIGEEIRRGRFPHAAIIDGGRGFGKHLLAREIAMALACEKRHDEAAPLPCGECHFCRKIKAGNCPDVITIGRVDGKATIGVDTVRELRRDIATVPNDLDVKVYIIEDADTMTAQAQNALLLTLEEPPRFVVFLLLTENSELLLETVRSRAPTHRLRPIGAEALRRYLLEQSTGAKEARRLEGEAPEELDAIVSLSGGSIGKAQLLLDSTQRAPLLERRARAAALVPLLLDRTREDELLLALLSLGENRKPVAEDLEMLSVALRDLLLLCHAEEPTLLFYTNREEALELSSRTTAARFLSILDALTAAADALASNANVKLTLMHLFTTLSS